MDETLGPIEDAVRGALDDLDERDAVRRLWERDHTLWRNDPTEIVDRLGWLESPSQMRDEVGDLIAFADEVAGDGITDVIVAGMGGSSLFPDVLARTFGGGGAPRLHVLDSTDPAAVRRAASVAPPERRLVVVASKSGTTIETRSHLAWFWEETGHDGSRFVAITDPGSELADLGRERGFRRVFANRPDIGGRYSAMSYFGLVPAALAGVDVGRLLDRCLAIAERCGADVAAADNPAVRLGAVLAAAARAGRDKATLVLDPRVVAFGDWVEQLVAESTGKAGTGVAPIVGEPLGGPEVYGDDRLFVGVGGVRGLDELSAAGHPVLRLPLDDPYDLGAEVLRWEIATAIAGAVLGVNPFDQPDVAAAKAATSRVLDEGLPDLGSTGAGSLLDQVGPGDHLVILAYVDPGDEVVDELGRVRVALRDRLRVATSLGIGPRYLHSTGQLHKGGPPDGVFLMVIGADDEDLDIPGTTFGFSTLKHAQAAGDLEALRDRGLRVGLVELHDLVELA